MKAIIGRHILNVIDQRRLRQDVAIAVDALHGQPEGDLRLHLVLVARSAAAHAAATTEL